MKCFKCFYCPYIQQEMWQRINNWIKYEGYIPSAEDIEDEIIPYCWCDKTGYKIWFSLCEDRSLYERLTETEWAEFCEINGVDYEYPYEEEFMAEEKDILEYIPTMTKRQRKRYRNQKYQKKLKKLWNYNRNWYPTPAYPVDKDKEFTNTEEEIVRYMREYSPRRAKYLRKISNKRVRKAKEIFSRCGYKKLFDYQWELW